MAALSLGAEGIEMGTRFIATKECVHAHPLYKQALVESDENQTVVIKKTIGAPARALANTWTDQILEIEKNNGGYKELKDYINGVANKRYIYDGKIDNGFAWAGQVMGLITDIPSVQDLLERIIKDAERIRAHWSG